MSEPVIRHAVVWCDIPVRDLDRARAFYTAIMGGETYLVSGPDFRFALLPQEGVSVGGCLYEPTSHVNEPSQTGPLVYINVDGRMTAALAAVEANGGRITQPCEKIGEHGFRALIIDSEGNRVALHSHTAPE